MEDGKEDMAHGMTSLAIGFNTKIKEEKNE